MTNQNSTPAPWKAERTDDESVKITGLEGMQRIMIARVFDSETDESNSRLIAAAPELLAACEYVIKWTREHDNGEGNLFGRDFVTTCINATRKAKGQ